MLIYTHIDAERLNYTLDIVFTRVLGSSFRITTDRDEFHKSNCPKLAYTKENTEFDLCIHAQQFLFENSITSVFPDAEKNFVDFPKFFKSEMPDFLGYDLFAMVFYFATRYEEYQVSETDEHQRFKAENSLAYNFGCLQIPFLNVAIQQFGEKLKLKFPDLKFGKRRFNFLSTIDIDNAFAYAKKGVKRNLGGMAKDLLAFKISSVFKRISSNLDEKNDPYNTFDFINSLCKETQTALQYFVLIGDYSRYDKNPDYRNDGFRKLLKSLASEFPIGIHPSYESYSNPDKISVEIERLEGITGKKITSARSHFLRIKLPETYRAFIENGITDDYTMIYASQSGFRTGLCIPYRWFDLEQNKPTNLMIHPSVIMEGTLRDYNKLSSEEAITTIFALMDKVKEYGGEFVSIFHNDSFVPDQEQWINVYKSMLNRAFNSSVKYNNS